MDRIHELSDMKPTMLGTSTHPCLATKAAETGSLVVFCRDLIRTHVARVPTGPALLALGDVFVRQRTLLRTGPRRFPIELQQEIVELTKRIMLLRPYAGVPLHPKWHLLIHIAVDVGVRGNPCLEATWLDESYNGSMANVCRVCHSATRHRSMLSVGRYQHRESRARRSD